MTKEEHTELMAEIRSANADMEAAGRKMAEFLPEHIRLNEAYSKSCDEFNEAQRVQLNASVRLSHLNAKMMTYIMGRLSN